MPDKELRVINVPAEHPLQLREDSGVNGLPRIVGYTAVYDQETVINGWFREIIRPGFFTRALSEQQDVRALFNHNSDNILARTKSGSLQMREDEFGLWVEISPPDTQVGRDLVTSIRRGDITGMSFAFTLQKSKWTEIDDEESSELDLRELLEIKQLYDVGPVVYPAYEQTTAQTKSGYRSIEDILEERNAMLTSDTANIQIDAKGASPGVESKIAEALCIRMKASALPPLTKFNVDFPSLRNTLIPDKSIELKRKKARERELLLLELENGI